MYTSLALLLIHLKDTCCTKLSTFYFSINNKVHSKQKTTLQPFFSPLFVQKITTKKPKAIFKKSCMYLNTRPPLSMACFFLIEKVCFLQQQDLMFIAYSSRIGFSISNGSIPAVVPLIRKTSLSIFFNSLPAVL